MKTADGKLVTDGEELFMVVRASYGPILIEGRCLDNKFRANQEHFTAPLNMAYSTREGALGFIAPLRVEYHGNHQMYATVFSGDVRIAEAKIRYSTNPYRMPYPVEVLWTGTIDEPLCSEIETVILDRATQACRDEDARIEQGRRDWAAMSQAERDRLNEYAMRTEGHTID